MALFDEPTVSESTGRMIRDDLIGWVNHSRAMFDGLQRLVWQNPYALAPQQVFDIIGTRGKDLLTWATDLAAMVAKHVSVDKRLVSLKPAGVVVTINADGTVTLS